MHADFIKESALKRLNTMIEKDRNHWLETFEALDEQNVVKLPKDVFFSTVEVCMPLKRFFVIDCVFNLKAKAFLTLDEAAKDCNGT